MVIDMIEKISSILKNSPYLVPKTLFLNYKKLDLSEKELIMIIYLININDKIFNVKRISDDFNISVKEVLEIINSLSEKGLFSLEVKKENNKRIEYYSLDELYEKVSFLLIDNNKKDDDIYSTFEKEFGRTLSPMEYEIIGSFTEHGYSKELVLAALKEATYNGVSNLRYIDKILYEWNKKGLKSCEDIRKEREKHSKKQSKEEDVFDYDWLNEKD